MEAYDYMCSEKIKIIVKSIEELHVRRGYESYHGGQVDLIENAKWSAKRELLEAIGDFIGYTVNDDEGYVEAVLYLPYVQDSVVKRHKEYNEFLLRQNDDYAKSVWQLRKEIEYLKLPWWKKLIKAWNNRSE